MNKEKLVAAFIQQLETELSSLEANIKATRDEATHEESKPENQYDTRALETGYLVKAQSKRILDAKEMLSAFKHTSIRAYNAETPIGATALIQILINNKPAWFFYMPSGGGASLDFEGRKIQVITPISPLGEALLDLKAGDYATVESGNEVKEYEILTVE